MDKEKRAALEQFIPPEQRWWGPDDELVGPEEIAQVEPRVGLTPQARLQWALDFARRDLAKLTPGEWADLRRALVAFDVATIPHDQMRAPWVEKFLQGMTNPESFPLSPVPIPSVQEVHDAQRQFHSLISRLLETGGVEIPIEMKVDLHILQKPVHGRTFFSLASSAKGGRGPLGLYTLANLLGGLGILLRKCPELKCGQRWFVASRPNRRYCSPGCQSRATSRAYREATATQNKEKRGRSPRRRGSGAGGTQKSSRAKRSPTSRPR